MGRSSTARSKAYFERALRDAEKSGSLPGVDVPSAARALLAYFQGALLLAKTSNDASIIDALADRALSLVAGSRLESI
jgi:TetR/AcrR family transcriptional regulator, transcriptional repressor for nem operon